MILKAKLSLNNQSVIINLDNVTCFLKQGENEIVVNFTDGKHVVIHGNYDEFVAQITDYFKFHKGYNETLIIEEPSDIIKE